MDYFAHPRVVTARMATGGGTGGDALLPAAAELIPQAAVDRHRTLSGVCL
jgi:hypothetical protein